MSFNRLNLMDILFYPYKWGFLPAIIFYTTVFVVGYNVVLVLVTERCLDLYAHKTSKSRIIIACNSLLSALVALCVLPMSPLILVVLFPTLIMFVFFRCFVYFKEPYSPKPITENPQSV